MLILPSVNKSITRCLSAVLTAVVVVLVVVVAAAAALFILRPPASGSGPGIGVQKVARLGPEQT